MRKKELNPSIDAAEATALHRYAVIAEAANSRLSPSERGQIVRTAAARLHTTPEGDERAYSRSTLERWLAAYREKGLSGLRPQKRADQGAVRRHKELFEEACALRKERPERSAAHISDIIVARHGIKVSDRTIRSHLREKGLTRQALLSEAKVYGRYEAEAANERWIGDVLHGPWVPYPRVKGSQKAKLFLYVDDFSRTLVHGKWVFEENARSGQIVLRQAIVRRGLPESIYVDQGSPFASGALHRTCAVLGIRLIHSRPYSPQGRGKQERLNQVIRERFILEAETAGIKDLDELNERFMAWTESVLNTRIHAETKETPISRFLSCGPPRTADPSRLAEAFRWSAFRKVTKTATVSLAANRYQVDPSLVGRRVEMRYDPEDLTSLDVYLEGTFVCVATPHVISTHVHPAVPQASNEPPPSTGVDYLGLVVSATEKEARETIAYRDLKGDATEDNDKTEKKEE